jgi:AcrR family transcriptional regulator
MTQKRPREERQHEILEAALRIFVRKGYADTRMDDIVEATGLSKGAIYHHFASKHELFVALIEHWMDQFAPVMRPEAHESKASADILRVVARFAVMLFKRNPDWFLAEPEIWSMANRDKEINSLATKLYARILKEFEVIIDRGIRYGEFRDVNVRLVALSIMTTLHGMIWFVLFQPEDFSLEDYVDANMSFIINGILNH